MKLSLKNYHSTTMTRIVDSSDELLEILAKEKITCLHAATGAYDIVHPGHIWSIKHAINLGCTYVIAVVSADIASAKKHGFTWFPQIHRAFMIAPYANLVYMQKTDEYSYQVVAKIKRAFPEIMIVVVKADRSAIQYQIECPDECAIYSKIGVQLLFPKTPIEEHGTDYKNSIKNKLCESFNSKQKLSDTSFVPRDHSVGQ